METQHPPAPPLPGLSAGALGSVLQAIGGLRNRQAALALLGCLFVGVLVAGLAGATGGFGALLGALVLFIAVGTGVNTAGVLLMDQARGAPPRALVDALVYGLMCIPKLILLGLVLLAIEIAVFIVTSITGYHRRGSAWAADHGASEVTAEPADAPAIQLSRVTVPTCTNVVPAVATSPKNTNTNSSPRPS